jgi:electron transfer flavoprotein alpha/beta subunit
VATPLTPASHKYADGVRYASLANVAQAKRKPLEVKKLADVAPAAAATTHTLGYELPAARKAGVHVQSVEELVTKLFS